ncbi:hypothetical protein FRB90_005589, partial [Tulasnella sp. 427]
MNQNTDSIPNPVRLPFEIIDHILSFASRPALFNCLFTCKAYSDFAKSHLWRRLPTAIPLFDLLGPTSYTGLVQCLQVSWKFNRSPLESQWETFAHYAQLVKSIGPACAYTMGHPSIGYSRGTTDRPMPQAESQIYLSLHKDRSWARYFDPSISVEALQTLHTIPIEFAGDQVTRSIFNLTPNLEHLDFVFLDVRTTSPWAFAPFLGPRLRSLRLWFPEDDSRPEAVTACIIGSFKVLIKALSFSQSSITALQTIEIRLANPKMHVVRSSEADTALLELLDHCPALRKLHYGPRLGSQRDAFLSKIQIHLPDLVSLSVCIDDVNDLTSFASRLSLIRPEMEELHLGHNGHLPTSLATLTPLLAFRNLRTLSLFELYHSGFFSVSQMSRDRPWLLTPDLVTRLSAAWPKLRYLSLQPREHIDVKSLESFRDEKLFEGLEELTVMLRTEREMDEKDPFPEVDVDVIRPLKSLRE